jgi:hypothetical protein
MASQVLSGASNPSYTNNTGQNVRVIINYMRSIITQSGTTDRFTGLSTPTIETITINWAGLSATAENSYSSSLVTPAIGAPLTLVTTGAPGPILIGKSLGTFATVEGGTVSNGAWSPRASFALPLEILLAPGQTFSAVCSAYNIIVIPENG